MQLRTLPGAKSLCNRRAKFGILLASVLRPLADSAPARCLSETSLSYTLEVQTAHGGALARAARIALRAASRPSVLVRRLYLSV